MTFKMFGNEITIKVTPRSYFRLKRELQKRAKNEGAEADPSSKIWLIKNYRSLTGAGLKDSKDVIEEMFGYDCSRLYD
jgi:ribosomal protein L7/L12